MTALLRKTMKIRTVGDPVLEQRAKEIKEIDDDLRQLAVRMVNTMYQHNGVGLAGNQVGMLKRIIVIDSGTDDEPEEDGAPPPCLSPGERELNPRMPVALINPQILSRSDATSVFHEGCLSLPKLYADVKRSTSVLLRATLLDGRQIELDCGGFLARILQHEIDHLDGIVFVQKAEEEDFRKIEPSVRLLAGKAGSKHYKVKRLI